MNLGKLTEIADIELAPADAPESIEVETPQEVEVLEPVEVG